VGMGRGDQKPAFSKAVIDEKQRAVIVKDALDLLKKYEFDGVDVDFEGWDNGISTDREKAKGLGMLWTELRSKLPKTKRYHRPFLINTRQQPQITISNWYFR